MPPVPYRGGDLPVHGQRCEKQRVSIGFESLHSNFDTMRCGIVKMFVAALVLSFACDISIPP
jgi:hypothetical protein